MNPKLMRYFTACVLFFCLMLTGNAQVSAQTTADVKWELNTVGDNLPAWHTPGNIRGIGMGTLNSEERIYVPARGTPNKIRVLNPQTGAEIGLATDFDLSGVAGGTIPMNDLEVSDDGYLFLGNLTLGGETEARFKLYIWDQEGGAPVRTVELPTPQGQRIGDKFRVFGSVADNTVEIWATVAGTNPGLVHVITTSDQGVNWDIETITLTGDNVTMPANSSVEPLGLGRDSDFYITGNGSTPKRYTKDGEFVAGSLLPGTGGRNGMYAFEHDGKQFLAVYTYTTPEDANNNGRVVIYDVTQADDPESVLVTPTLGTPGVSTYSSIHGMPIVRHVSDDAFVVYVMDGVNGYGAYEFDLGQDEQLPGPLAGIYYIPKGENPQGFSSLGEALAELNEHGATDAVVFLIDDDLDETENTLLINREDLTETTSVTIKPAPGKTPTITVAHGTGGARTGNTGFSIEKASYVTIDGSNTDGGDTRDLTITFAEAEPAGNSSIMTIYSSVNHITVKNTILSHIHGEMSRGLLIDRSTGQDLVGQNITIEGVEIGHRDQVLTTAVFLNGVFGTGVDPDQADLMRNITINDSDIFGTRWCIYVQSASDLEFTGNHCVINGYSAVSTQTQRAGIQLQLAKDANISGNMIEFGDVNYQTNSSGIGGIFLNRNHGPLLIANNMINFSGLENSGSGTSYVIGGITSHVGGTAVLDPEYKIYHNTILLDSPASQVGKHVGIGPITGTLSGRFDIRNNIVVNRKDAENAYAIQNLLAATASEDAVFEADYNNLYVTGEANVGFWDGAQKTLADWQAASEGDEHSVSFNAQFRSDLDLRLAGSSVGNFVLAGTPLADVPVDGFGNPRDLEYPYMGAHEADIALVPGLAGEYFIPRGDHDQGFDDLEEAIQAINDMGLTGPTTWFIDDDVDHSDAQLPWLERGSLTEDTPLLIRPAPGKTPVVSFSGAHGLAINNTSWITIDGDNGSDGHMTFHLGAASGAGSGLISITSLSRNIAVKNLIMTVEEAGSMAIRVRQAYSGTTTTVPGDLTFTGIRIGEPGKVFNDGFVLWSNVDYPLDNVVVEDNVVYAARRGITTFYIKNNTYRNNEFHITGDQVNDTWHGTIYVAGGSGEMNIYGNRFMGLGVNGTGYAGAILLNASSDEVNIFNNFIAMNIENKGTNTTNKVYGIVINHPSPGNPLNIMHNTILIPDDTGLTGLHAALGWERDTNELTDQLHLVNNIMVNLADVDASYGIEWPWATGIGQSDYNNIYVPDGDVGFWNDAAAADLTAWQTAAGQDDNSVAMDVEFVSNTDLTLTGESLGDFDLAGTPLAVVGTDIFGTARDAVYPYMGAFEGVRLEPETVALSGTYYIPQGDHDRGFINLVAAFRMLSAGGAEGPVTFLITDDLDETRGELLLSGVNLTETNSLLIKPAPETTPTITLGATTAVEGGTTGLGIFNTSWITIDGSNTDGGTTRDLTIMTETPGVSFMMAVLAGSKNVTIRNTNLAHNYESTTIAAIRSRRDNNDTMAPENLLLENNKIGSPEKPFGIGVIAWGTEGNPNHILVHHNEIYARQRGVTTFWNINNEFIGNTIELHDAPVNQGLPGGLYLVLHLGGETVVANNVITRLSVNRSAEPGYIAGININSNIGDMQIYNNLLGVTELEDLGEVKGSSVSGIAISNPSGSSNIGIYHNTFRFLDHEDAGVSSAIGWAAEATTMRYEFVNNIVHNEIDSETAYAMYWPHSGAALSSNYNNLMVAGADAKVGHFDGEDQATLADWRMASGNDQRSSSIAVEFVSDFDWRLGPGSVGDNRLAGTPIASVAVDFDGNARNEEHPYMGAFEGDVALEREPDVRPFALSAPASGAAVDLEDVVDDIEISWEYPMSVVAWARYNGQFLDDQYAHVGDGNTGQGRYIGTANDIDAWLQTPLLINPGTLSFWAATFNNQTVLNAVIEISGDGGATWEELEVLEAVAGGTGDINIDWSFHEVDIDLEGEFHVRFRQSGSVSGSFYLDDVVVSSTTADQDILDEDFESWAAFRELLFVWHLDASDGDFSEPLLSLPSDRGGQGNTLTLSPNAVDGALADLDVAEGATFSGKWTVTADLAGAIYFADEPFAISLKRMVPVGSEVDQPYVFALDQNYPNPFNPATTIRFSVPQTVDVRLEVYNVAGQRVATLVSEQRDAGIHMVTFDGTRLASGVYIYRIIAGDFVETRKMMLIK